MVGERRVAVGLWIERRDGVSDGILREAGNPVTQERLPAEGIDRGREQARRKIAVALGDRRHIGDPREALRQPRALVVGEEEGPIANDRAAQRAAELVPLVGRRRLVLRREVVARVERAGPHKVGGAARQPVRARPRDDVDLGASRSAERGIRQARQHLELTDGVHRRPHRRGVELGIEVEHAIEQKCVGVLARAVDAEREVAADRSGRSLSGGHRAGDEQREVEEVAPVEWQIAHLSGLDARPQRRCQRIDRQVRRPHNHDLVHRARLQHDAHAPGLVDQHHGRLHHPPEAGVAHLHPIRAGFDRPHHEPAGIVGAGHHLHARVLVDHEHLRARDLPLGLVHDLALQAAGHELGAGRGGPRPDQECDNERQDHRLQTHHRDLPASAEFPGERVRVLRSA